MNSITVSAKTVNDAIMEASIQLGVVSTEMEYEVIEEGSAGFLGIGRKQAVIRAWKKVAKKEEKPVKPVKVEKEIKKENKTENKPVKKEVKATVSGVYITGVKGVRGPLETPEEKKGFFARFKKDK